MSNFKLKFLLKTYLLISRKKQTGGFSLAELLVASVIGVIVTMGVLWLSNDLLQSDRKEQAKSRIEQEITQGMDYIAAELQQAIYIYQDVCVADGNFASETDKNKKCPGIKRIFSLPTGVTPVLAFWKTEPLPYSASATGGQLLPTDCGAPTAANYSECVEVLTSRNTYTLVIYSIRERTNSSPFVGPAQITRYELRKYDPNKLSTLDKNTDWPAPNKDPNQGKVGFNSWPCNNDATTCNTTGISITDQNNIVLADLVEQSNPSPMPSPTPNCTNMNPPGVTPAPYSLTPPSSTPYSFFACVRNPELSTGNIQDAKVVIKGNGAMRANQKDSKEYLISVERIIKAKSVLNRDPQKSL